MFDPLLTFCLPSLKNHGAEQDFVAMWGMGEELFKLPLDEKLKYEQGDEGRSFGCVMEPGAALQIGY